jgi:hypothetical protein
VETAAIFPAGKYTWIKSKHTLKFTKAKKEYTVKKGSMIGVRPATSKKGVYRVVSKDLGVNIVFSVDQSAVNKL